MSNDTRAPDPLIVELEEEIAAFDRALKKSEQQNREYVQKLTAYHAVMAQMREALQDIGIGVRLNNADNSGIDHEHIARELYRRMVLANEALAAHDRVMKGEG